MSKSGTGPAEGDTGSERDGREGVVSMVEVADGAYLQLCARVPKQFSSFKPADYVSVASLGTR